jgi:hypothetical protein
MWSPKKPALSKSSLGAGRQSEPSEAHTTLPSIGDVAAFERTAKTIAAESSRTAVSLYRDLTQSY